MTKPVDAIWFNSKESLGMVAVEDDHGFWKAYLGTAKNIDENADMEHIASNGAKVSKRIAIAAFENLDPSKHRI